MTDLLEFKASLTVTDTGEITGIAWPFGSADRVGDVIEKGAFTAPARLPMLFAHDQAQVIGVWDEIAETADALTVKGRLLIDGVERAREVRAMIRAGAVSGLSIGFVTKAATPRARGRTITALDLHEISVVAVPAHPGAQITSLKSNVSKDTPMEPELKTEDDPTTPANAPQIDMKAFNAMRDRLDKLEAKANRPGVTIAQGEATGAERKAFGTYLRFGNQTPLDDLKALTVSADPQAGYLAPAEMSTEFVRNLVEFSPIRALASVRATGAPSVKYPKRTSITNAQWEDELEESQESGVGFGMIEVPAHKLTTFVDASNELLADSAGAAEAEVRQALAEDFGKKEATAFLNGTGDKQPEGLMIHSDIPYTPSGVAAALTDGSHNGADALISLMYALSAPYRNAGTWAMNGTTLAAIRKLKDGDGRFLWQQSFAAGQPETILGRPVVQMDGLADIGAGNFPVIFGDFSAYRIVDRLALSILSDPYTQARKGVTRIHATRRTGGRVLQAARFRKLKIATA